MLMTICVLGIAGLTLWAISLLPELPQIESIEDLNLKVPLRVYSADGLLLAEYGEERRIPLSIEEAPETLVSAILAAEDDRFYTHTGVDFVGIIRARCKHDHDAGCAKLLSDPGEDVYQKG